jgi:hypothetical protein
MNALTKTLLAGAALGALTAAPAMSTPNIHLVGKAVGVQLGLTGLVHHKTNVTGSKTPNFTTTASISGTFTSAAFYKTPTLLYAYDWLNGCTDTGTKESFKSAPKKTAVHKIKTGSVTGTRSASGCGATIFTYRGPNYDRKVKGTSTDHFVGTLKAKGTSSGTLTAHFNTTLKF